MNRQHILCSLQLNRCFQHIFRFGAFLCSSRCRHRFYIRCILIQEYCCCCISVYIRQNRSSKYGRYSVLRHIRIDRCCYSSMAFENHTGQNRCRIHRQCRYTDLRCLRCNSRSRLRHIPVCRACRQLLNLIHKFDNC